MKIAVHHHPNSFSERWIKYCEDYNIQCKLVNCYDSNIIEKLNDCDGLMWHWHHADPKAILFAKQLTYALEKLGKKVFPDSNTAWHFDDKVGQKYLLEGIGAPFIPAYVSYTKSEALEWAKQTIYPKVFKLRGGAGSRNVRLVKNFQSAKKIIKRCFGKGYLLSDPVIEIKERFKTAKQSKSIDSIIRLMKGFARLAIPNEFQKLKFREKGYVFFQDFISGNDHDLRVVIIGNKAVVLKRLVRNGDFRASGSGKILYVKDEIDKRCIQIAFETSDKLNTQCLAYDFVFDRNNNPLIIEISYAFSMLAYDKCPGYWDIELNWHIGKTNLPYLMIEDFIKSLHN